MQRLWTGLGLVLLSAGAFAANTTSAVVAYGGGASPMSVLVVRLALTTLLLLFILRALGVSLKLSRRERNVALWMGVGIAAQSWLLLSAVELIPVGLAILTFYLYPIFMAVGAYLVGHERPGAVVAIGFAAAFVGLTLALDVEAGSISMVGVGLAALSALTFSIVAVAGAPVMERIGDSRVLTLYMHFSATPIAVLVALFFGEFPLPETTGSWTAMIAVPLLYTVAVTAFFAAVPRVGAVRTGLLMNLEPVMTLALGFLILSQTLNNTQLAGVAIVVLAMSAVRGGRSRA